MEPSREDERGLKRAAQASATSQPGRPNKDEVNDIDEVWGTPKQDIQEYWEKRGEMELKGAARSSQSLRKRVEQEESHDRRVMWSAIVWAVLFTGVGHYKIGRPLRGTAFVLAFAVVTMIAMYVVSTAILCPSGCSAGQGSAYSPDLSGLLSCSVLRTIVIAILLGAVIHLLSVVDVVFLCVSQYERSMHKPEPAGPGGSGARRPVRRGKSPVRRQT